MTSEKLSIKDLCCSTCTNPDCPTWIGTNLKMAQSGKMRMHVIGGVVETLGCCYHPLALQVLAQPIIEELEKRIQYGETNGFPEEFRDGLHEGYQVAIKLLNERVGNGEIK